MSNILSCMMDEGKIIILLYSCMRALQQTIMVDHSDMMDERKNSLYAAIARSEGRG